MGILQDLRYAIRVLRQSRLATAVALIALALGTGANTAIFSVVHSVLLRPLAYHEPDQLMTILGPNSNPVAPAVFLDVRNQASSFSNIEAAQAWGANLTGGDVPEQVHGLHLSPGMFQLLGISPLRGRADIADQHSLVISYGLWQRRFGGAENTVGRTIRLDGETYTIAGIMPSDFRFAPFWVTDAEMWAQLDLSRRLNDRRGQSLRVFGRLKPNLTAATAQAEVTKLANDIAQAWPDTNAKLDLRVDPLREKVVGKVRPALLILLGAVALVLLIACANVASISLARAAARQREIAIRLSLGAARSRIIRQLLTESVVLSLAGGALGFLLAFWGIRAAGASPLPLPRAQEIGVGVPVLLFTLAISIATGLLFGLAPALTVTRPDVGDVLKHTGRGISAGRRGRRFLVAAEIALAFVLLTGAGLLLRSFMELRAINPGFDQHHLLTLSVSTAGTPTPYTATARENLFREIVERIEAAPGVKQTAMINHLPLAGDVWSTRVAIAGRPAPQPGEEINTVFRIALPGYFSTLRIPIAAGRDFTTRDREGAPGVTIINESFARHEFGDGDPIGQRIAIDAGDGVRAWLTVVGVVKDVRQGAWAAAADNEIYLPFFQDTTGFRNGDFTSMMIAVRTSGDPAATASAVRSAICSVDRNLPLSRIETMETVIDRATSQSRLETLLVGLFATVALTLAVVGIYGVIAYEVTRRTREIGIRMALGSNPAAILRLVLGESMSVAAAGLLAGGAVALMLSGLLRTLLYQVTPTDPATFAAVGVLVMSTAVLAALVPAIRASGTDPAIALREE